MTGLGLAGSCTAGVPAYIRAGNQGRGNALARRSGYSAQKRRRELDKQKKREEKRERAQDKPSEDQDALVAEYLGLAVEPEDAEDQQSEDGDEESADEEGADKESADKQSADKEGNQDAPSNEGASAP